MCLVIQYIPLIINFWVWTPLDLDGMKSYRPLLVQLKSGGGHVIRFSYDRAGEEWGEEGLGVGSWKWRLRSRGG